MVYTIIDHSEVTLEGMLERISPGINTKLRGN